MRKRNGGFTLIEILMAVVIFAIVGVVVSVRLGDVMSQSLRIETRTFATWVAQNSLAELQLHRLKQPDPPAPLAIGNATHEVRFADRDWQVQVDVSATSHPQLRRVDIAVTLEQSGVEQKAEATLVGFVGTH